MTITTDQIRHVAYLARLELDETGLEIYTESIARVLELIDQMNEADTEAIEPLAHPGDAVLRLRPDRVDEINQRDLLQSVAPVAEDGLYLVPKVIE